MKIFIDSVQGRAVFALGSLKVFPLGFLEIKVAALGVGVVVPIPGEGVAQELEFVSPVSVGQAIIGKVLEPCALLVGAALQLIVASYCGSEGVSHEGAGGKKGAHQKQRCCRSLDGCRKCREQRRGADAACPSEREAANHP